MLHSCYEPDYSLATNKAAIAAKGNGTLQNEDYKQRGQQLLAALLEASRRRAWIEPGRRMDVSDVVLKYIPVGTSFADAQDILRYAGMTCGLGVQKPPKPSFVGGSGALARELFSGTDVGIQLFPTIPGDFTSNVGDVHAGILASEL
jgi:hypothetical protein